MKLMRVCAGIALIAFAALAQGPRDENAPGNITAPPPRLPVNVAVGPDLGYVPLPDALPLPPGMTYASVAAIDINSKGHIFVFERAPVPLLEFDRDGKFIRAFGEGLAARSHGLRIDSHDNIWITDVAENTVTKLNPQGEPVMTLGTRGPAGEWNEAAGSRRFNQPVDLAFAPNGDVFVAQGHGGPDPRIFRFDKNGKLITQWSGKVDGPASFSLPHTLTLDPKGNLYVADREAKKILVFDVNGKYIRTIQKDTRICAFYVTKDKQLYMTSGTDGQLEKLDWNGKILGITGGGQGKGPDQYGEAHYMTIDAQGDIYVADTGLKRVQKLVKQH